MVKCAFRNDSQRENVVINDQIKIEKILSISSSHSELHCMYTYLMFDGIISVPGGKGERFKTLGHKPSSQGSITPSILREDHCMSKRTISRLLHVHT